MVLPSELDQNKPNLTHSCLRLIFGGMHATGSPPYKLTGKLLQSHLMIYWSLIPNTLRTDLPIIESQFLTTSPFNTWWNFHEIIMFDGEISSILIFPGKLHGFSIFVETSTRVWWSFHRRCSVGDVRQFVRLVPYLGEGDALPSHGVLGKFREWFYHRFFTMKSIRYFSE